METVINFFALRPTFSFIGLQVVWYVYLCNVAVQLYVGISGVMRVLAQRGVTLEIWSPKFLPLFLGAVAQLLLVRLLLEVAAIVIAGARSRPTQE